MTTEKTPLLESLRISHKKKTLEKKTQGAVKTSSEGWSQVADTLYELKEKIKSLKEDEAALRDKLIELSNNDSAYNDKFIFKVINSKGRVQYAKLVKDLSIDVEPYRGNSISSWKIEVL